MNTLPYVITSRVRLARNVRGHRFPPSASGKERQAVLEHIQQAISQDRFFRRQITVFLDHMPSLERKMLEERHLISHFSAVHGSSRAVILPEKRRERTVILINEEDHVRIQAFSDGLALQKAWKSAHILDQHLHQRLEFAVSRHDGYLTTCPNNTGSGLRASAMIFVPGLILLKRIASLIRHCVDAGYTVRGTHGEGSESQGYVLQISYQHSRERHTASILRNLEGICKYLIEHERQARLLLENSLSYGLRRRMRKAQSSLMSMDAISLQRGLEMIAMLRLAAALGMRSPRYRTRQSLNYQLKQLDQLTIRIQPAHIRAYGEQRRQHLHSSPESFDEYAENRLRATLLQQRLGRLCLHDLQNAREKLS